MHPAPDNIVLKSEIVKKLALEVGFDACGIAKADKLDDDRTFLVDWLSKGYQGTMTYLERNIDKRTNPQALVPGCKSVVALLFNYYTAENQPTDAPKIARYAYSEIDYHQVIKKKLSAFEEKLKEIYGPDIVNKTNQHSFVDSAPILERRWAQKAGLGWIGKHSLLINPEMGSYIFIAILLLQSTTDKYDQEIADKCGNCTKCLNACPTQALSPRILEARKCISYLTIENKELIPTEFKGKFENQLIGCDICQDVCPWNKKLAHPHIHPELYPNKFIVNSKGSDWSELNETTFNHEFKSSAIKRAGYKKLKSNLQFISPVGNPDNPVAL